MQPAIILNIIERRKNMTTAIKIKMKTNCLNSQKTKRN